MIFMQSHRLLIVFVFKFGLDSLDFGGQEFDDCPQEVTLLAPAAAGPVGGAGVLDLVVEVAVQRAPQVLKLKKQFIFTFTRS
jgi:hypothetical protein